MPHCRALLIACDKMCMSRPQKCVVVINRRATISTIHAHIKCLLSVHHSCSGLQSFHHSIDLLDLASQMGFHKPGLQALGQQLLHAGFTKSSAAQTSNWEAEELTLRQVR